MGKYKATVNVDRELWDKAKAKCKELETNVSREFTAFLEAFIADKPYKYELEADWDKLPESVKVLGDILLARLKNEAVPKQLTIEETLEAKECTPQLKSKNTKTDTKTDTKTVNLPGKKKNSKRQLKNIKTDIKTDTKTDSMKKETTVSKSKKPIKTEDIVSKKFSEEVVNEEGLEDWAKRAWMDEEVAKIEGLTRQAIARYRNNERQPKDKSFWNRWERSTLNDDRWWQISSGFSFEDDEERID